MIPRELCGIPNEIRLFRKVNLQQCDSFSSSNQRQMKRFHDFFKLAHFYMKIKNIVDAFEANCPNEIFVIVLDFDG